MLRQQHSEFILKQHKCHACPTRMFCQKWWLVVGLVLWLITFCYPLGRVSRPGIVFRDMDGYAPLLVLMRQSFVWCHLNMHSPDNSFLNRDYWTFRFYIVMIIYGFRRWITTMGDAPWLSSAKLEWLLQGASQGSVRWRTNCCPRSRSPPWWWIQKNGNADTNSVAGVAGMMLRAAAGRLRDSSFGFFLGVDSCRLSHEHFP